MNETALEISMSSKGMEQECESECIFILEVSDSLDM
jgi:hypothetical protein